MIDLEDYSDNMKTIVHVAYAASHLTVFNIYIKQRVKCPKDKIKKYKKAIKDNLVYINNYKELSFIKKIQFIQVKFSVYYQIFLNSVDTFDEYNFYCGRNGFVA